MPLDLWGLLDLPHPLQSGRLGLQRLMLRPLVLWGLSQWGQWDQQQSRPRPLVLWGQILSDLWGHLSPANHLRRLGQLGQ